MPATATVVAAGLALFFSLLSLYAWLTTPPRIERRRARGRARRRGGYVKPPASSTTNQVLTYTIGGTRSTVDYFSSPGEHGERQGGSVILRTRLAASRNTEPGSSTDATARAGANGAPRGSVDWSRARAANDVHPWRKYARDFYGDAA